MSKSATIRAAWISGTLALIGALIGAYVLLIKPQNEPTVSAKSSGDSAPAIAIGGDVKDSNILINPTPSNGHGLTKERRTIVDETLEVMETLPALNIGLEKDDKLLRTIDEKLARDPYDIKALLMRGQWHYIRGDKGATGLKAALQDFERASDIDKELADPHFGIGSILYHLAIFDLAKRGRFRIHEKGSLRVNRDTGLPEILQPKLELFIDKRNRAILEASLDEFQTGRKLRQYYTGTRGEPKFMIFSPVDIENRIRSVRGLLGYEPPTKSDGELVSILAIYLVRVEPNGLKKLFRAE